MLQALSFIFKNFIVFNTKLLNFNFFFVFFLLITVLNNIIIIKIWFVVRKPRLSGRSNRINKLHIYFSLKK
jgi:hypothetical protein